MRQNRLLRFLPRSGMAAALGLSCAIVGPVLNTAHARDLMISDGSDEVKHKRIPQMVIGMTLDGVKPAKAATEQDDPSEDDTVSSRAPGDAIMDGSDRIQHHTSARQADDGLVTLVLPDHDRLASARLKNEDVTVDVTFARNGNNAIVFGTVWRGTGHAADKPSGKKAVIPVGMTFSSSLKLDTDDEHPDPITIPGGLSIEITMLGQRDAGAADNTQEDDPGVKSGGQINSIEEEKGEKSDTGMDEITPPPQSDGIHHSVMKTKGY